MPSFWKAGSAHAGYRRGRDAKPFTKGVNNNENQSRRSCASWKTT
ncbi:hypothetical protein N8835_00380 [Alphaproteobacteria bacterium]|nr:hypothetical protein [Alphaproteobacteria bacterium]